MCGVKDENLKNPFEKVPVPDPDITDTTFNQPEYL